jgi:hypothetical protein
MDMVGEYSPAQKTAFALKGVSGLIKALAG